MSNAIKTAILMAVMTAVIVSIGALLGGTSGILAAFSIAAVTNLVSYWFSDKIVLRAYGAKLVSSAEAPDLHGIVQELSVASGIPKPRLYLINSETPNAFAIGRDPQNAAVAVTRGIIRICNREELKGVLAHELSHIKNRDILVSSIAATMAGALMVISSLLRWDMLFGLGSHRDGDNHGLLSFLSFVVLAPIAATLIQLAISRTREYLADETGALIANDPIGLAVALRKLAVANQRRPLDASPSTAHMFIVNPLSGGRMLRLFSTHPAIEDRIRRLERLAVAGVGASIGQAR
jgi:heat shock protein HtpX